MPAGQLLQFDLRAGIDEGTDPKLLPPGTLTQLVNGVWRKEKRIDKRHGTAGLGKTCVTGSDVAAGKRLFARGDELCLVDGSYLYSYAPGAAKWARVDQVPDASMTWTTAIDPFNGVAAHDLARSSGGFIIQTWVTGDPFNFSGTGLLWCTVTDANGEPIIAPSLLSQTASGCRVLIDGTTAYVIWRSGGNLTAKAYDLATMTAKATQLLRVDMRSTSGWDAMLVGSTLVFVFENSSNLLKLHSYTYNLGTNVYTSSANGGITGEASNDFRCISIDGAAGEVLYVGYCDRTGGLVRVATANASTLAQVTAPVTVDTGTSALNVSVRRLDASHCIMGWSFATTSPDRGRFTTAKLTSTLTLDLASFRGTWGSRLISRIFFIGSRMLAFALDYPISGVSTFAGGNSCLVEIETSSTGVVGNYVPHRYLGKVDMLLGGASMQGYLCSAAAISSEEVFAGVPFLSDAPATTANWRCGVRLVRVSTGSAVANDMWRSVTVGGESYLAGALLHAYDGHSVFDYGFSRAPVLASSSGTSPTAGVIAAGTYLYALTLEYRSRAGILHRSPTAVGTAVAPGATSTIALSLVGTNFTSKVDITLGLSSGSLTPSNPIELVAWRSVVNGKQYQRLSFEPRYNVILYDYLVASQSLSDTVADADIGGGVSLATRPFLYTTGGVLDDHQPPNCITHNLHKNRLWLVGGDRRTLWFSKSFQDSIGVAPGFHPDFRILMDGNVVALATMDEMQILLGEDRLWYQRGEGPAPNGDGAEPEFLSPTPIMTDVGCVNARSVCAFPGGLFFESARGLSLLSRNLEVTFVGGLVEDTLAAFPNITSAVLVPKQTQVRITCNDDAGTAGRVLVFDYRTGQWSTFTYTDTSSATANTAIVDACLWQDRWTFVTPNGKVFYEDSTTFLDGGTTWVSHSGEIAWIAASGPLGFQRVRRAFIHGDLLTDCDLTLAFGYDHDDAYAQTWTWTSDKLTEFADGANIGMRCGTQDGANPRCRAFRARWSDGAPTGPGAVVGTGQGCNFSAFGMEIVPKPGMDRRGARQRA
jgi:hypothetical protein